MHGPATVEASIDARMDAPIDPASAGPVAPVRRIPDERIESWAGCLRLGITGHRLSRLGTADLAAIEAAVVLLLEQIGALLPAGAAPHLVSSLAEGADSIAAAAACHCGWTLDAVLPLPRDRYIADFRGDEARGAYLRCLERAEAVLELPASAADDAARDAAYERAGRVMLAQSDILLAIWDGEPARGRGGAAQIIAEAVLLRVPVIHLDPARPDALVLLWDGLSQHGLGQQSLDTVAREPIAALDRLVPRLCRLPPDGLARKLLAQLARAELARPHWFTVAYPLLQQVTGARRLKLPPDTGVAPAAVPPAAAPSGDAWNNERDRAIADRLERWFVRADAGATAAGQAFRSAYVTNFSLAAFAVLASLAGLVLPGTFRPLLGLAELGTTVAILLTTHLGRRARWHRRWLEGRHLAERLRCLRISWRLGDLGLHRGGLDQGDWVDAAMRAIGRMTGLLDGRLDEPGLAAIRADLSALIDDQLGYLRLSAARMHRMEHRLHRAGTWLFATTGLICVLSVGMEIGLHFAPALDHVAPALTGIATVASALLPAMGGAIYGIRMQGDFAGVADRDATLARELASLRELVIEDELRFDTLWRRARHLSNLLTQDVVAWLHAYRARPLVLPG